MEGRSIIRPKYSIPCRQHAECKNVRVRIAKHRGRFCAAGFRLQWQSILQTRIIMIKRLAERDLRTSFGTFTEILYYDGLKESVAIVMGGIADAKDVLCRIHSSCIGAHVFNSVECTCREEMEAAQAAIAEDGRGVIVYLDQEGKGNGHLALVESIPFKNAGLSQADAYVKAGYKADARSYRPAAEILNDLKVISVILLSGNPEKAEDLRREGILVASTRELNLAGPRP